jgi:hypothetical protein
VESEVRIASTEDLNTIFSHQVEYRLPRRLNTYQLEHLDPDGAHVLIRKELAACYRAEILMKFAGEELPYVAFIDVPVVDWQRLRTYTEALNLATTMSDDGDTY